MSFEIVNKKMKAHDLNELSTLNIEYETSTKTILIHHP